MAQAEFREVLTVDQKKLFEIITRYDQYPEFVEGCKAVNILRVGENEVRVEYQVNVMSQEVNYTLDHRHDVETGRVEWTLVDSNFFKKNNGKWELRSKGKGKTEVFYALDIEFKVPVPGFILNRLIKGSLPGMVKSFEKRASSV